MWRKEHLCPPGGFVKSFPPPGEQSASTWWNGVFTYALTQRSTPGHVPPRKTLAQVHAGTWRKKVLAALFVEAARGRHPRQGPWVGKVRWVPPAEYRAAVGIGELEAQTALTRGKTPHTQHSPVHFRRRYFTSLVITNHSSTRVWESHIAQG